MLLYVLYYLKKLYMVKSVIKSSKKKYEELKTNCTKICKSINGCTYTQGTYCAKKHILSTSSIAGISHLFQK